MGLFDLFRRSPSTAPVTDPQAVARLVRIAPSGHRVAQDVVVAAAKYIKAGGMEKSDRAKAQSLQATIYALGRALEGDGYIGADDSNNARSARVIEFLDQFAQAYPNWRNEHALLKRFVPLCFS